MRHDSAIACTSNVRDVFTRASPRNYKQTRDLKGDKGTDFVSALQLRACEAKFKSPLSTFLNKKKFTNLIKLFANFKTLLTRLSRLLNLGCTTFSTKFRAVICSLINFKICQNFLKINRMQCEALKHALLTLSELGDR